MKWLFLLLLTAAVCSVRSEGNEKKINRDPILLNADWLRKAKEAVQKKHPAFAAAYERLIKRADSSLTQGPFSVMNKTNTPPSGDKHDYMSQGAYWWPDPTKKDGLPYIRRDGERNPETLNNSTDVKEKGQMTGHVTTLSRAWFFSGKEKYAERAALLLRTWFLDPESRMNPHLEYGQAIPGRVEGRGIGIIDTASLTNIIDSACLLSTSDAWTEKDHQALQQWFRAYARWLLTSSHGKDERKTHNNHGAWYDVQVAAFSLFAGDNAVAEEILRTVGKNRIAKHIKPDGSQPHELARTRSFSYSVYNLMALTSLARLGEHTGLNLWQFQVENKAAIQAAVDYVGPFADPEKKWPHKQITEPRRIRLLLILRHAYLVYKDPKYLEWMEKIPEEERGGHISALLYPAEIGKE